MTIGERLREERDRLGLSQPKFAALAATTKQTLFSWETGKTAPDGFQMAALAAAGVDVQFVLTGQRSSAALAPEEQALLSMYRAASKDTRNAALGALIGATSAHPGTVQKYQGDGGVMIGAVSGQANVRASKKKG